jgi:hypothetical protein
MKSAFKPGNTTQKDKQKCANANCTCENCNCGSNCTCKNCSK